LFAVSPFTVTNNGWFQALASCRETPRISKLLYVPGIDVNVTEETLVELEARAVAFEQRRAEEEAEAAAKAAAKQAAQDKLKALGLSDSEVAAITGGI